MDTRQHGGLQPEHSQKQRLTWKLVYKLVACYFNSCVFPPHTWWLLTLVFLPVISPIFIHHPYLIFFFLFFFFKLLSHSLRVPKPLIKDYKYPVVIKFVIPRLVLFKENLRKNIFLRIHQKLTMRHKWKIQRKQHQESIRSKARLSLGKNKWSENQWWRGFSLSVQRPLAVAPRLISSSVLLTCREMLWWYHATIHQAFCTEGTSTAKYS